LFFYYFVELVVGFEVVLIEIRRNELIIAIAIVVMVTEVERVLDVIETN